MRLTPMKYFKRKETSFIILKTDILMIICPENLMRSHFAVPFADVTIIPPADRVEILNELFKLIINESSRIEGLQQLAFYIKEVKKELSVSNNCYVERQNEILNKIKNYPKDAMSIYISKYKFDLEEIVECGVWYVFDSICMDVPNIEILQFLINGMDIGAEIGYDQSILKIRSILLERLWNLVFFENRLPISVQETLIHVYPKYFIDLLTGILDKIYLDDTDLMLVRLDLSFQRILRLCQLYKNAFQVAYRSIAKKMMIKSHPAVQTFLDNFLSDVKSSMRISEFPYHYDDELINYVVILNECNIEDDAVIRHFLNRLKESNYLNFYILLTHFPEFMYLFD